MDAPKLYVVKLSGALVDHRYLDSTIFRWVWQHLPAYLETGWADGAVQADIGLLRSEAEAERMSGRVDFVRVPHDEEGDEAVREAAVEAVRRKLQESRRTPAVEALTGRVLLEAFTKGGLTPQVYGDARAALAKWSGRGCAVVVYDELPSMVQEAWLRTSSLGDLSSLVTRCLRLDETDARDPSTWAALAKELGTPARLATDRTFEALAAGQGGLEAVVLERGGVYGAAPHGLRVETNLLAV